MVDTGALENQLSSMMKVVLEVYNDLANIQGNKELEVENMEENDEKLRKKTMEIKTLSNNLNKSIDECQYLTLSNESLDKEIEECFEEKKKKLEEYLKMLKGVGKIHQIII